MIDAMPRQLPYLHRERTRHGKTVWYVRRDGARIRVRGEFGSPDFLAGYRAALEGVGFEPKHRLPSGSLRWLVARYRETTAWLGLSMATRRQRENIFRHVLASSGDEPYKAIKRQTIMAGRERRASTPSQARNFLDAMRGLFRWAVDAGLADDDPTIGVRNPRRPAGAGFPVWTEDDVTAYEARWPLGTKERVWLDVLLYTGLRRGDAMRIGRQHVRDGMATIRTEKTGMEVSIPILPVLAVTLAAGPCGDLAYICGESGRPLTKESFGNVFRAACRAAGVAKSAHGLRKIAATRAANAGATVAELDAIFGWQGGTMASHYTRTADRKRLAKSAASKLVRGAG